MWIIVMLAGLIVVGAGLCLLTSKDCFVGPGLGMITIGAIGLGICGISIATTRHKTRTTAAEYQAMFDTIRDADEHRAGPIERIMNYQYLLYKISDANEWIRVEKTWNRGSFDWWVDDMIEDVEEFRWGGE